MIYYLRSNNFENYTQNRNGIILYQYNYNYNSLRFIQNLIHNSFHKIQYIIFHDFNENYRNELSILNDMFQITNIDKIIVISERKRKLNEDYITNKISKVFIERKRKYDCI